MNHLLMLIKYGDIVQDLADRGHNWHFYDELSFFATNGMQRAVLG
jgi:hypothetical protein